MKIIQRYYMKDFLRLYILTIAGLGLLSGIIEIVTKVDNFLPNGASLKDLLFYSALNIPRYLLYLMPVVALISGLFVIGQAGKKKETVAIRAAGGSMKAVLIPFLYLGLLLSITSFLMGETVVPDFSKRANKLRASFTKKKRDIYAFKDGAAWLRVKDHIIKIDLFLPDKGVIKGISIMKMEDDMLTERIEAESAEWRPEREIRASGEGGGGLWRLTNVTDYNIKTGMVTRNKELQSDLIAPPNILGEDMQGPEEMNVRELFSYTRKLQESGIKNTKLVADMNSRLSYPFINLIMLLLGISLAGRGEMKRGLAIAASGIAISLVYWLGYIAMLSLGYMEILPPALAPWLVPAVFGGIAAFLFIKMP